MPRPRRHRLALMIVAGYLLAEILSAAGLWALAEARGVRYRPINLELLETQRDDIRRMLRGEPEFLAHHPVLGWAPRPGSSFGLNQANAQGVRAAADCAPQPGPWTLRIAAFGDSFTYGDDVASADSWPTQLTRAMDGVEVLNLGVPAYGPDQAWLRYREHGRALHPHVVLIGVMSENLNRAVNVYRPFYSPHYEIALTKPRFVERDDALVLLANPLPHLDDYRRLLDSPAAVLASIGAHDTHFAVRSHASTWDLLPTVRLIKLVDETFARRSGTRIHHSGDYSTDSEAFRVVARVVEGFAAEVIQDGRIPLVLLLPDETDLRAARSTGGHTSYAPLRRRLERAHRVLDLAQAFAADATPTESLLVGPWSHYSAVGNGIVARAVHAELEALGLNSVRRLRAARTR